MQDLGENHLFKEMQIVLTIQFSFILKRWYYSIGKIQ
jgi:hypothetical protein